MKSKTYSVRISVDSAEVLERRAKELDTSIGNLIREMVENDSKLDLFQLALSDMQKSKTFDELIRKINDQGHVGDRLAMDVDLENLSDFYYKRKLYVDSLKKQVKDIKENILSAVSKRDKSNSENSK